MGKFFIEDSFKSLDEVIERNKKTLKESLNPAKEAALSIAKGYEGAKLVNGEKDIQIFSSLSSDDVEHTAEAINNSISDYGKKLVKNSIINRKGVFIGTYSFEDLEENDYPKVYDEELDEELLDEKIPKDLARALARTSTRRHVPDSIFYSGIAKKTKNDRRPQSRLDLEKIDYKEISNDEALKLYKEDKANLSSMLFLIDPYPWRTDKEYKVIRYNDEGVCMTDLDISDDKHTYTRKSGDEVTKVAFWPPKHTIAVADKIYWAPGEKDPANLVGYNTDRLSQNWNSEIAAKRVDSWSAPKAGKLSTNFDKDYIDNLNIDGEIISPTGNKDVDAAILRNATVDDTGVHSGNSDYYDYFFRNMNQYAKNIAKYKKILADESAKENPDQSIIDRYEKELKRARENYIYYYKEYVETKQARRYDSKETRYLNLLSRKKINEYRYYKQYLNKVKDIVSDIQKHTIVNDYSTLARQITKTKSDIENYKNSIANLEAKLGELEAMIDPEEKAAHEKIVSDKIAEVADKYYKIKNDLAALLHKEDTNESLTEDTKSNEFKKATARVWKKKIDDRVNNYHCTEEQAINELVKGMMADPDEYQEPTEEKERERLTKLVKDTLALLNKTESLNETLDFEDGEEHYRIYTVDFDGAEDFYAEDNSKDFESDETVKEKAQEIWGDGGNYQRVVAVKIVVDPAFDSEDTSVLWDSQSLTEDLELTNKVKSRIREARSFNLKDEQEVVDAVAYKDIGEEQEEKLVAIDPTLQSEDDEFKPHAGNALLYCEACGELITCPIEKLVKDEETGKYFIGDDHKCPHCGDEGGLDYKWQLADAESEDAKQAIEETSEEEPKEEPAEENTLDLDELENNLDKAEENGEEIDLSEIKEESFDRVINKSLTRLYENIKEYKTTAISEIDGRYLLEGILTSNDGKEIDTAFDLSISKDADKYILEGFNKTFTDAEKAFKFNCTVADNALICESLNYSFEKDVDGVKYLVEGLEE